LLLLENYIKELQHFLVSVEALFLFTKICSQQHSQNSFKSKELNIKYNIQIFENK